MDELYYKDALKLGLREYRNCLQKGQSPCLSVLDDFVPAVSIAKGIDLGIVQIPLDKVVGTKSRGRLNAFAPNFMPVLEPNTEFADKWQHLCEAHVSEGIRDPIKAYEYMNRYYVEEGNKRVSVLKFFDALTVTGRVIRIMPEGSGEDIDIYHEFVEFYKHTKINYLEFSKRGCYALFLKFLGKDPEHDWSEEERNEFAGVYYYFNKAYIMCGGGKLNSTPGDALLSYIQVYGYPELCMTRTAEISKNLKKMWEEVELTSQAAPIEVMTEPPQEKKQGVISKMITAALAPDNKVAFIHDGTPEKSGWVHDHEKGRNYVERVFEGKIETKAYYNAMDADPLMVIESAIGDGANIIFTTSPRLTQASLRAAVENPDVIIMNCTTNKSHRYISCYYTRMYEAKFILGAIAGSLTESGKLGYVCDYPIYGQIAAINAFALGAQMTNPRSKVYLEWSAVDGAREATQKLVDRDIHFISSQDTARFQDDDRYSYGLSYIKDKIELIANPVYKWGVYYEQLLRRVLNRTIQSEQETNKKALNFFWGMSAGVVDVVYSPYLTLSSKRFGDFLKDAISQNVCTPFLTPLYTQNGEKIGEGEKALTQDQIISMDYLVENVIGDIPLYKDMTPMGKATAETAGVEKAKGTVKEMIEAEKPEKGEKPDENTGNS